MVFRKLKFSALKRRCYLFGFLTIFTLLIYSFSDKLSCLDLIIDYEISRECSRYFRNEITGNYCPELCAGNSMSNFACLPGHSSKWIGNKSGKLLILNRAQENVFHTESASLKAQFVSNEQPNANDFNNLVRQIITRNFNKTLPQDQLNNLVQLKNEHNQVLFRASQEAAWSLIQDNDYLIATLYEDKELFPRVYGICGSIFFTEHLGQPVRVERGAELTLAGWKTNIKLAVLILDFIEELEQSKLVMCDIDTNHFGIIDNRMKYGDMTIIFSTFFINKILRSEKPCTTDVDCSYKGCKSVCNKHTKTCSERQLNNNLQIVCEKVFKGTTNQPGILYWNRTPKVLKQMVERCVNPQLPRDIHPHKRLAPSTELRNLIYNELANIYETLGKYSTILPENRHLFSIIFPRQRSVQTGLVS